MAKVIDMQFRREHSLKSKLRDLYNYIDETNIYKTMDKNDRKYFYPANLGEFLQLFRKHNNLSLLDVSQKTDLTEYQLKQIEDGFVSPCESLLFRLCDLVGANQEIEVFLEKIQEAIDPRLKIRKHIAEELLKYGIRSADDGIRTQSKSKVIRLNPNKERKR